MRQYFATEISAMNDELASLKSQLLAAQVENKRLREALTEAGEATAYQSHDDSVGYHVCCNTTSYLPHEKDCYIKTALATQPDLSLLSQHDEQVKREGSREALMKAADQYAKETSWHKDSSHAIGVINWLRGMIAALDQPTEKEG